MVEVLRNSWALLLGIALLMVGNGLQATLMGVRGAIEGFSTFDLALVTSGYFVGFLGGSRLTPVLIRRVGHVRVFAALGSFISAAVILFPAITDPVAWIVLRVIIGFSFCGVYITAESWLNNAATNETRGQALSAYMIAQMAGVIAAQGMMNVADPAGWILFVIPSVLVSLAFAPILLAATPVPAFATSKTLSLRQVFDASPLSFVGMFLLGGVFAAQFGMSAVYGTEAGLSVAEISIFVAMIFAGALVLQYPIGWLSDRMDRRVLILGAALAGGLAAVAGALFGESYAVLLAVAFVVGGVSNPLYSLLIAYLNDYLDADDMAGASGGLLFVNGLGAIAGPPVTAVMMGIAGPGGFWMFVAFLLLSTAGYALWRMTRRPATPVADTGAFVTIPPTATPVFAEVAQEVYAEAQEEADAQDTIALGQGTA